MVDSTPTASAPAGFRELTLAAAMRLGASAENAKAGTAIALGAGNQETRVYHDAGHFNDLASGSSVIHDTLKQRSVSPAMAQRMGDLYAIAGRDHDIAYIGADGKLPPEVQKTAGVHIEHVPGVQPAFPNNGPYLERTAEGTYRIRPDVKGENITIAMEVFGYKPGQVLNPFHGQNEFISTVHSLEVNKGIAPADKVALSVLIHETVPFSPPDSVEQSLKRADKLGILSPDERRALGMTAAHFANRDVANFAGDRTAFRENTVRFLQEGGINFKDNTNIAEKVGKQAGFFEGIKANMDNGKATIFRNHGDLMSPSELAELNNKARAQIENSIADLKAIGAAATAESKAVALNDPEVQRGKAMLDEARGQVVERNQSRAQAAAPTEAHTAAGRLEGKAARGVTVATGAVNAIAAVNAARNGDKDAAMQYTGVVVTTAAMEAINHKETYQAAGKIVEKVGVEKVALATKALGGKIPLVGAVVATGFAAYEITSEAMAVASGTSNWKKLASTTASSLVGIAGGIIGFGAGEVGQELVHGATKAAFGEKDAAKHSATVEVGILAHQLATASKSSTAASKIDAELTKNLSELEKKGWANILGNKDTKLTLDELKQSFKDKGITLTSLDKDGDGKITGKEITDALWHHRPRTSLAPSNPPPAGAASNIDHGNAGAGCRN